MTGIAQDGDNRVTEFAATGVPAANIQVVIKKVSNDSRREVGLIKQRFYVDGAGVNFLASPE